MASVVQWLKGDSIHFVTEGIENSETMRIRWIDLGLAPSSLSHGTKREVCGEIFRIFCDIAQTGYYGEWCQLYCMAW